MENNILSTKELEFLTQKEYLDEYPNIQTSLNEPRFSISDLGVTPRDATYWDQQGILPEIKGPGTRRKYDLLQSVWIKLIQQMRSLEIGLSTIKKVKDGLLNPQLTFEEALAMEGVKKAVDEYFKKKNIKKSFEELLDDPAFRAHLKTEKINPYEIFVLTAVIYRKHINLIVNKDGAILPYECDKYKELIDNYPDFRTFILNPHFTISISEAYASLVKEWVPKEFFSSISLLSNTEMEILEAIRSTDVDSVKIIYKTGEPYQLEITKTKKVDAASRIAELIAINGFHEIHLHTRNGKIVHYKNTQIKRIGKSTR